MENAAAEEFEIARGLTRVFTFLVGMLVWPDLLSGKIITEEEVQQWKSGWGVGGC